MKLDRFRLSAFVSVFFSACAFFFLVPIEAQALGLGKFLVSPADEITLQAALAAPASSENSAILNRTMRDVEVRTALEDTKRLHFELG